MEFSKSEQPAGKMRQQSLESSGPFKTHKLNEMVGPKRAKVGPMTGVLFFAAAVFGLTLALLTLF